jgi:hypothetical protein
MSDQVDIERLVKLVDEKFKSPTPLESINAFPPLRYLIALLVFLFVVSFGLLSSTSLQLGFPGFLLLQH